MMGCLIQERMNILTGVKPSSIARDTKGEKVPRPVDSELHQLDEGKSTDLKKNDMKLYNMLKDVLPHRLSSMFHITFDMAMHHDRF